MPGIVVVILMMAAFGAGLVVSRRAAARAQRRTGSAPTPTSRQSVDEIQAVIVDLERSQARPAEPRESWRSNRFVNTEPLWKVSAGSATPNPFEPEPAPEELTLPAYRRADTPRRFTRGSVVPGPTTAPLDHAPQTLDDLLTPPDGVERVEPTVIVDEALLRGRRE